MNLIALILLAVAAAASPTPTPAPSPTHSPSPTRTPNAVTVEPPPPSSASKLSRYAAGIKLNTTPGTPVVISGGGDFSEPQPDATPYADSAIDRRLLLEVNSRIMAYCEDKWPDGWEMLEFCFRKEHAAARQLERRVAPLGMSVEVFGAIRRKCEHQWTDTFDMWDFCEQKEIKAFLRLQESNSQ